MSRQPDPLAAARSAITRAGFGTADTKSGGVVVRYPADLGPGNRQRLRDALRLAELAVQPVAGGFAVECR